MQSEFDDILKNKLSSYSADFSPADWQQMEAMLPEKSNKPYALIALLLLFVGIGGLLVGMGEFEKENNAAATAQENSSTISNDTADSEFKNAVNNTGEKRLVLNSEAKNFNAKEPSQFAGLNGNIEKALVNQSDNVRTPSPLEEGRGEVVSKKKNSFDEKNNKVSNDSGKSSLVKKSRSNFSEADTHQSYSSSIENAVENSPEIQNNTETVSALTSIESGFIKLSNEEKIFAEKSTLSDDAMPTHKSKKQIATFAMGIGAGMNFSFIGAGSLTKPGYAVDIAQELMFINRIGLSFTQGYTLRKYDGGQYPCPSGTIDCPYSYSSVVRSMDFGVDIKANLIKKTKWNWYVKAGIINTVKLKEDFSYQYPQTDTIIPPTLSPQTNFNGGSLHESLQDNGSGLNNNSGYLPDLTISGIKRYHIAYHAATGFDVALRPNLHLQVEAGESFTQPAVGAENRRLHSIGINGRLFYRFGR